MMVRYTTPRARLAASLLAVAVGLFGLAPAPPAHADSEHGDSDDDESAEQDFLFLLEEGYLQERDEWQVDATVERFDGPSEGDDGDDEGGGWLLGVGVEYGILERLQVEAALPLATLDRSGEGDDGDGRVTGIGDLELAVAYAATVEGVALPQIAVAIEVLLPTGRDDIGAQGVGYEVGLAASKHIIEGLFIHGNAGMGQLFGAEEEGVGGDAFEWEVGIGAAWRPVAEVTALAELTFESERLSLSGDSGAELTERESTAAVSLGLAYEPVDDLIVGVGAALGLTEDSDDTRLFARAQIEW